MNEECDIIRSIIALRCEDVKLQGLLLTTAIVDVLMIWVRDRELWQVSQCEGESIVLQEKQVLAGKRFG